MTKTPLEPSRVLDRGGKPTVRELLSSIAFNPADGTIRLNGDRVVMQRAAVAVELRRELTSLLGEEEMRVFLLRLGFRSGQADARFVRAGWPHLDPVDGFTAGTRLHTFSGVVRVETVHNAFDFRKKQLTAEFLWHDSIEAEEFRRTRLADGPVCWTQLGYASGYASEFFDTLIVYKEVECAGQGHAHCRVVGKPAEQWGLDEPIVRLLRERVLPPLDKNRPKTHPVGPVALGEPSEELDRLVLAPVAERLRRVGRSHLPVLICGEPGTGRMRAARHIRRLWGCSEETCLAVPGARLDESHLSDFVKRSSRRGSPAMLLIDDAQDIAPDVQAQLGRMLEGVSEPERTRVVAVADGSIHAAAGLRRTLWQHLAPLALQLPSLRDRGDASDIAAAMLPSISSRLGIRDLAIDVEAMELIAHAGWPGNLAELRAVLTAAASGLEDHGAIQRHHLAAAGECVRALSANAGGADGSDLATLIAGQLANGGFALADVERTSYEKAIEVCGGNLSAAARLLGISRAQLAYRTRST